MAQKLGLNKQYASIPLAGGLDLKTDPKQVDPPKLLQADNVMYLSNQMLRKRYGWTSVTGPSLATSEVYTGISANGPELLVTTTEKLATESPGTVSWITRDNYHAVNVSRAQLGSTSLIPGATTAPSDIRVLDLPGGKHRVISWHCVTRDVPVQAAGFVVGVLDQTTNTWVQAPVLFSTGTVGNNYAFPTPVYDSTRLTFYVLAIKINAGGGTQDMYHWGWNSIGSGTMPNLSSPSFGPSLIGSYPTSTTIAGGFVAASYAAQYFASTGQIAIAQAFTDGVTAPNVYMCDNTPGPQLSVIQTLSTSLPASTNVSIDSNLTMFAVAGQTKVEVFQNAGGGSYNTASQATSGAGGGATFTNVAIQLNGSNVLSIVGVGSGGTFAQQWQITFGPLTLTQIFSNTFTPPEGLFSSTPNLGAPPSGIMATIDVATTPTLYTWLTVLEPISPNSLILNNYAILVRWQGGTGAPSACARWYLGATSDWADRNAGGVQNPIVLSGTSFLCPFSRDTEILPDSSAIVGVAELLTVQTAVTNTQLVPLAKGVLIADNYPKYYDGETVVPAGIATPPIVQTTTSAGSNVSGPLPNQTYGYAFIWVRRDAFGQLHRSAPFFYTYSHAVIGGSTYVRPTFSIITSTTGTLWTYRTIAAGTSHFYVPIAATVSGGYTVVTDTVSDGSITSNATVYTDANELTSDAAPPMLFCATSKQRLYAVWAEDPTILYYTKPFALGHPPEWNANQFNQIDATTGPLTAVAVVDDNVVCFKVGAIYVFSGLGPDATGNGAFSQVVRLPTDCGCTDPASVIVAVEGVYFKGNRGICLLTRSLELQYVGLPVDTLTTTVTSAQLVTSLQQIRFLTNTNKWLVFDYLKRTWSTYSSLPSISTTMLGSAAYMASASTIRQEAPGTFTDNGSAITMTVQTPWLKTAGMQGWGRTYRAALLGDYKSASALNVTLNYDYNTSYSDSLVFNTSTGLINGDSVFQFRMSRLPRQVMQAVTFTFADSGTTGESYDISNLTLEYGQKAGLAKLPGQKTL